jgi:AcrR family transcriptional regulator
MNATATRLSAEERRDEIVAAAMRAFAAGGYTGTSTESIARQVGVSQPYLFQLFGTKRDLFLAAIHACFARTRGIFEEAARQARADGATDAETLLWAMGEAYCALLRDRQMLLLQLQAYAACGDPAIREVVGEEFVSIYRRVGELSGADDVALEDWFAKGMLMNTAAAIGPEMAEAGDFSFAALGRIATR